MPGDALPEGEEVGVLSVDVLPLLCEGRKVSLAVLPDEDLEDEETVLELDD